MNPLSMGRPASQTGSDTLVDFWRNSGVAQEHSPSRSCERVLGERVSGSRSGPGYAQRRSGDAHLLPDVARDLIAFLLEVVVVRLNGIQVGAPPHGGLGHQGGLVDLFLGCSEEASGFGVEMGAVPAARGSGDAQTDQLLVLVRDCGLSELEILEARPLALDQMVRNGLHERGHRSKHLRDLGLDVGTTHVISPSGANAAPIGGRAAEHMVGG